MPTVGERLATLEVIARENRDKIDHALELIDGGEGVPWERSVRGRLHAVEGNMHAMGVVTKQRVRILRGWQAVVLTICAVITAAAAVVSAISIIIS